ncbi:hypothetical protein TNCV_2971561 [Trichonephila clavipes]|nr:hypothetical protein TNCV_2971561 [Trichonephila clavipes]
MLRQRVRLKLRTHDNIYRDGMVRGETRPLDFKIVEPAWMKKGVVRKLRKSEIEFQKRCFKRRAKPKVTIWGDKASHRLYWDRGKRSSRDIIIMWRGHRGERKDESEEGARKENEKEGNKMAERENMLE